MEKVKEIWVRFSDTETYFECAVQNISFLSVVTAPRYTITTYPLPPI